MSYLALQYYELGDDEKNVRLGPVEQVNRHWKSAAIFSATILLASLSFNFHFSIQHSHASDLVYHVPSIYGTKISIHPMLHQLLNYIPAGLYRDMPTEIVKYTDYNSPNRTIENAAWDNPDLLPEHGFIALDDSWAASKSLPTGQRWPWNKSKGVYILTSSHELHCVVSPKSIHYTLR